MTDQVNTELINEQVDKATKIVLSLIVANIGLSTLLIVLAVRTPAWQLTASIAVGILLTAALLYAYSWIRRGRVSFGLQLTIYAVILSVLLSGSWLTGLGIIFTIGLAIVVFQMTSLVLSLRQATYAMIATIITGLFLVTIDNLDLSFRLFLPQLVSTVPILALLLGLVFAYQISRNFSQFGLRGKLVISTILVATLGVVVVAVSVQYVTQSTLLNEAGKNIETRAESGGVLVGEYIFRQLDTLQSYTFNEAVTNVLMAANQQYEGTTSSIHSELVAQDSRWRAMDENDSEVRVLFENDLAKDLLSFQDEFSEFQTVLITDQFGVVVAATGRPEHYYFGNQFWWKSTYNAGLGYSTVDLVESSVQSDQGISIAVPITDPASTEVIGVLYGLVSLNGVADILQASRFGETGNLELNFPDNLKFGLNSDGQFALQPNNVLEFEVYADIERSTDGFTNLVVDGQDAIVSIGHVQTLGHKPVVDALDWDVVAIEDQVEVFALVKSQQNLNVLLGAIVIVIAGAIAAFVGQRLTEPIIRLKETALLVQEGDLTARSAIATSDEVGELASVFNEMTARLAETLQGLERRVAERTRVIETSARVSRNLTTILDPEQLVQAVVAQVRSAFDYYHAQIYLWDEFQTQLVMAGGTGEAGEKMLALGHVLAPGQGLVGRAAEMKLPVLIPDVEQEEGWLPNELLPLTKAETAVPILIGKDVVGVLDVQHSVVNGLGQQDVELIQAVANQFAIAYQNARNYSMQQKQAQYEAQVNDIRFRIQETQDVDEALKVTIRELGRVLGASKTAVKMHVKQTENGHD